MLRESDIHKDEKMQEDVMAKYVRYQYNTFLCVKREEYNLWIHFLHLRSCRRVVKSSPHLTNLVLHNNPPEGVRYAGVSWKTALFFSRSRRVKQPTGGFASHHHGSVISSTSITWKMKCMTVPTSTEGLSRCAQDGSSGLWSSGQVT